MSVDGTVRPAPRSVGMARIPGLPAWLVVLVVPVATLALWGLAGRAGILPTGLIPTPSMTVDAWYVWTFGPDSGGFNAYSGTWGGVVLNSAQRVVQGYVLAVLIAVPVGILIGWSSVVARLIDPDHAPELTAAGLVGAIAEALVGPLSPTAGPYDPDVLVSGLVAFCLRATEVRKAA